MSGRRGRGATAARAAAAPEAPAAGEPLQAPAGAAPDCGHAVRREAVRRELRALRPHARLANRRGAARPAWDTDLVDQDELERRLADCDALIRVNSHAGDRESLERLADALVRRGRLLIDANWDAEALQTFRRALTVLEGTDLRQHRAYASRREGNALYGLGRSKSSAPTATT